LLFERIELIEIPTNHIQVHMRGLPWTRWYRN